MCPVLAPGDNVIIRQYQKYSLSFPSSFHYPKFEYVGLTGIAKPLLCCMDFIHQ